MIRAICLNPVVDRLYYIDDFGAGRQFKNMVPDILAGGKGVNVARVVSQLGETCSLYVFLGGNSGRIIESDMERYSVDIHPFWHEGETRMTVNIIDDRNRLETEITEQGAIADKSIISSFFTELGHDLLPDDIVICSGRPMKGMDLGIYKEISLLCSEKSAKCFLDTSMSYLKAAFPSRYSFFKPNMNELKTLFDGTDSPVEELMDKALTIGAGSVMVSTGRDGCLFKSSDDMFSASVPTVEIISTIGSGDASVAGFAVAKANDSDDREAVKLAMACGVSNAMHREVGFVDKAQVEDLKNRIAILD